MASVKVKRPATRGLGGQPTNGPILNQRDLLDNAGKGFEKFIRDSRQQNERATEINVRLRALGLEGMATREQFRDAVKGTDPSTEDGAKRFAGLLALAKDFASLTPPIEEVPGADLHAERVVVDNLPISDDDEKMSATTDKDYIDARLKAMSDSLDQRLETAAAKSDGRLEVIETRLDGSLASIEQMLAAKFSALDANVHKTNADTIKWTVGLFITIGALGLAIMTFLINNSGKFSVSQPPAAAPITQLSAPTPALTASPQAAPAPTTKP